MTSEYGKAHGRYRDPDRFVAHNLFARHLHLFFGVAVIAEGLDVGKTIGILSGADRRSFESV